MEATVSIIGYALGTAFEDHAIYIDEVPQALVKPCFFILPLESNHAQELGNRYKRDQGYVVHYISDDGNEAIAAVADKLTSVLADMEYNDDRIFGRKMNYHTEDGVLIFEFTVTRILAKTTTAPPVMGEIEVEMED